MRGIIIAGKETYIPLNKLKRVEYDSKNKLYKLFMEDGDKYELEPNSFTYINQRETESRLITPFSMSEFKSLGGSSKDLEKNKMYSLDNPSQGAEGKSAYQIAVENGFEGSAEEWIKSLKGEQGKTGSTGASGPQGQQGARGAEVELQKVEGAIQWRYTSTQSIDVSYVADNKTRTKRQGGDNTKLEYINLVNLPSIVDSARIDTVSLLAVTHSGSSAGSANPSRRPGVVPENSFPHLGNLDPSSPKLFKISNNKIAINANFSYFRMSEVVLEDMRKVEPPEAYPERISEMLIEITLLDNSSSEVGKVFIEYVFIQDKYPDEWSSLISLNEIKGPKGDAGVGFNGEPISVPIESSISIKAPKIIIGSYEIVVEEEVK